MRIPLCEWALPAKLSTMWFRLISIAALACGVCVLSTSCERGESKGKEGAFESSPFGRDLDRICHAEERSGAKAEPEGGRAITVANWLGQNLESQAGRDFLGRLARTAPADKAQLLTAEAAKLGIDPCPLAGAWSGAPGQPDGEPPTEPSPGAAAEPAEPSGAEPSGAEPAGAEPSGEAKPAGDTP